MRVLLIGLSSIGVRRVIPALAAIHDVAAIDIASVSKPPPEGWPKRGEWFSDYAEALASSRADLVYISLPNAHHEQWVLKGLEAGRHVVVDKPAVTSLGSARRCTDLAASRSLLIAEATVFSYHPQIARLMAFLPEIGPLTQMDAMFIIPPLPSDNFRNSVQLGGGCLLDMGPYAAAVARLFGGKLDSLCAIPGPSDPSSVDQGFSIVAGFADGLRYTGHFSFESEYQNSLTLVGRKGSVVIDRPFSPPADAPLAWRIRRRNETAEVIQPAGDTFQVFLSDIIDRIKTASLNEPAIALLQDAVFRDRLSQSLERGTPQ